MSATTSFEGVLFFSVDGTPRPAGSKRAFIIKTKAGGQRAVVTDDNAKSRDWKTDVSLAARTAFGETALLTGPLMVEMTFRRRRPMGHYGTRRTVPYLKGSSPPYPDKKPDVLKLARGVEDALTGIVWKDDSQIVIEHLHKVYVGQGEREGVDVKVYAA